MIFLDTLEQVRMGVGVKFALTDFVNIEIRPKWYKMKHNGGKAFIGQLVRLEIHIITKQALELGEGLVDLKHYMDKQGCTFVDEISYPQKPYFVKSIFADTKYCPNCSFRRLIVRE